MSLSGIRFFKKYCEKKKKKKRIIIIIIIIIKSIWNQLRRFLMLFSLTDLECIDHTVYIFFRYLQRNRQERSGSNKPWLDEQKAEGGDEQSSPKEPGMLWTPELSETGLQLWDPPFQKS